MPPRPHCSHTLSPQKWRAPRNSWLRKITTNAPLLTQPLPPKLFWNSITERNLLLSYPVTNHSPITDMKFGQNALHYAAACSKLNRCVVIQLIVDTKIDLNLRDHVSGRSDFEKYEEHFTVLKSIDYNMCHLIAAFLSLSTTSICALHSIWLVWCII